MIFVDSACEQPLLLPKGFLMWVQKRNEVNPDFIFALFGGSLAPVEFQGWRMRGNVISFCQDGLLYGVRILTGKRINLKDLSSAIGIKLSFVPQPQPFRNLSIDFDDKEVVSFSSEYWDAREDLEKSFAASKKK